MKIMLVFGTRPEAIKMAPVFNRLRNTDCEVRVCITAQHRQMLDQVLALFEIPVDHDLNLMKQNQDLTDITSGVLVGLREVLTQERPDWVGVHGDTTTTMAASLAAYYQQIPVFHVEAGLRTGNIYAPWPEEMNRRIVGTLANLHFAPTPKAAENLAREGVSPETILVTGNTVIDALLQTVDTLNRQDALRRTCREATGIDHVPPHRHLLLVTGHRRENFGAGFQSICQALRELATRHPDLAIVYPVHLNPNVRQPVHDWLSGLANVHLIEPLDYLPFVYLMQEASLVLTDSGGIQEEAPSLGKPVLVMRETTERPEAVEAGTAKLVGTNATLIVGEIERLMLDTEAYEQMSLAHNPYGDGQAAERIVSHLVSLSPQP
ncbi:UDP-N-acetylglucosamine 2-epimerase (non-hydrolyzing) [Marinobacter sp.]|jgi:UDP-N-acetylglucosamine 2-epimerase (non-hydrolysing)|uniref:non-hydrolyzing UDP-N-acetylglucosamine 2-epimerase n=1 Tax=Marinobacter sp. TaxID=50741 RepID=UPI0019A03FE0|nr:UDP-N-acetylglucosamine 2-epimerase (non-hydrolyzing) [Marinobacter sp.]MBC7192118.1 UDP-N-acetylglucosamine 2-epimerase (non-hydrolyzing) [Marinobacter sp.]